MLIERLANEFYPIGRDRKILKANFIEDDPSWLVLPSGLSKTQNGFATNSTHHIETVPFVVSGMSLLGFGVGNMRVAAETATPSIKLVSTDGTKEIGLYTSNKITYFRYIVNGSTVYEDNQVMVGSNGVRKSMLVAAQSSAYGTRPKNIFVAFLPELGYFHVVRNGVVIYSLSTLKTINTSGVNWSGNWKFVLESGSTIYGSSIELVIEQDI